MDRIDVLSFGSGFGNVDFVETRIGRESGEPGKPGDVLSLVRRNLDRTFAGRLGISAVHCSCVFISRGLVFREDFETGRKTGVALTLA